MKTAALKTDARRHHGRREAAMGSTVAPVDWLSDMRRPLSSARHLAKRAFCGEFFKAEG